MNQEFIPCERVNKAESDNCLNRAVLQIPIIQILDKQWAFGLQQIEKPQDDVARLGRRVSLCKINQKSNHEEKLYKLIVEKCSSWSKPTERFYQDFIFNQYIVFFDRENILPLETKIVNDWWNRLRLSMITKQVEFPFVWVAKHTFDIKRILGRRISDASLALHDPYQKFKPSQRLVDIVRDNMICPNEEELELLREIKKIQTEVVDEKLNITNMVTKQVEGLFTNVAKRIFRTKKKHFRITKDNRFIPEICNDLIDRLGLDVYNSRPVLELLYKELYKFVVLFPRERSWGSIIAENSEIELNVKEGAFKFPELSEIENKRKLATTTK